jgi:hypothetical protein
MSKTKAPTIDPSNTHRVGDVVSCIYGGNGTGEGILWRVTQVKGVYVWLTPILTLTGPSSRRDIHVTYNQADAVELLELAGTYAKLGLLIADIARTRGAQ